jgi:predicted DNA-binding protein (MmcQ/YjbR family)
MNIEEFRIHCLTKPGATESIPFPKLPNVLVFKVMGKMFTATDLNTFEGFSIKYYPEKIDELRAAYPAVQEPMYFSKKHWCNVVVDGSVSDKQLCEWLDTSYELVVQNLPKKLRASLIQNQN